MTVDIVDHSSLLARLVSCVFRKRVAEGPDLGLQFLSLPPGACDVLVPSRLPGLDGGKPLAPWKLVEDPATLPDLPPPPGFLKKGKGKGKGQSASGLKGGLGKSNWIASFTGQKGKARGASQVEQPDQQARAGSLAVGRFGVEENPVPNFGCFDPEELKQSTFNCTTLVVERGCCIVPDALPSHSCTQLCGLIDAVLEEVQQKLRNAPDDNTRDQVRLTELGSVHAEDHRWDVKLPLCSEVRCAVELLVSSLGSLLEDLVSRDAVLAELACVVSDPGAKQQPLHADTLRIGSACAPSVTVFVPLQDTRAAMGPTILCQGTHNLESHLSLFKCEQVFMPQDVVVKKHGGLPAISAAGTAIIMNSNLLHCGGANLPEAMGGSRRRLFYVTFQTPGNTPDRSSFSLREDLLEEYYLSDFDSGPSLEHSPDPVRKDLLLGSLRGDSSAMLDLGIYLQSQGDPGAVEYFRKAALKKNVKAFAYMADVFEQGLLGIPRNPEEATKLRNFGLAMEESMNMEAGSDSPPASAHLQVSEQSEQRHFGAAEASEDNPASAMSSA
ncbi:unnamed protein product [Symbiodinium pilosum]|uniref:Uncharacterized protein n=1 Tax=Symbiodinium pilosum TaxID=2952 RepID=A0A812MBY9_SYMPI|nr:unnamed protein product [Symbiodinium pilosum]